MNTPIWDFLLEYSKSKALRLHMPGHKGKTLLGYETLDITEIDGADSLYEANGIIKESEDNVSALFNSDTFYSTEGSSLCIRAMLYLCCLYGISKGERPLILACRNVHRSFLSAIAMLEADVEWIYPGEEESYLSCTADINELEERFGKAERLPTVLYITSPDYLGNTADIAALSKICKKYGVLLAVDNAHGAYLKFLESSMHPIDLGADICCDSAHKTLPVLTGGAYLHISRELDPFFKNNAKSALINFGSTSPSYLILASLDRVNEYITSGYCERLHSFNKKVTLLKNRLADRGYELYGNEALKISIKAKSYGYRGRELADILLNENIVCEFSDPDFLVMMLSPEFTDLELKRIEDALLSVEKKDPIKETPPPFKKLKKALSVREASFSPWESLNVSDCEGRILANDSSSCPPAVPIAVSGEIIDENAKKCFLYYNVKECKVIRTMKNET